jgi:hypothetical protein
MHEQHPMMAQAIGDGGAGRGPTHARVRAAGGRR